MSRSRRVCLNLPFHSTDINRSKTSYNPFIPTLLYTNNSIMVIFCVHVVPRCCDHSSGRGTKFDHWSDEPVTNQNLPRINRKLYKNIKSRYMRPRGQTAAAAKTERDSNRRERQLECGELATEHPLEKQSIVMSPVHLAYLKFVEADGRLDGAASALGYLLAVERDCHAGHLQSLQTSEFEQVRLALAGTDGSPLALVRAALAFVRVDGQIDDGSRDDASPRWLWAAELCLLAAASRAYTDGGGPVEVTCLFAAGWLYARSGRAQASARFLDSARRAADHRHRWDWLLPDDVAHATGAVTGADGRVSAWAAACFAEIEILMAAARGLDTDRALFAVGAACRLAEQCGMDNDRRARILYKLGVRYAAADAPDRAVECFNECAVVAAGTRSGRDLKARIKLVVMAGPRPEDDRVLQRIADEALARHCGRVLVKAIAARGHASARRGCTNAAGQHFALAHRLAVDPDVNDADVALSARLNAAVCRTSEYLQSNFEQLKRVGFDLLAIEPPRRWTGDRSSLVQRDSEGRMYLNAGHYQDAVVKSQARKILGRLSQTNEHAEVEKTEYRVQGGSVEVIDEDSSP